MTPDQFASALAERGVHVSRETMDRLERFDALLLEWSARHNLVARSTLEDRWRRHFLDSAQLYPLLPKGAHTVADLGAGAGFPGLVLAAMAADKGVNGGAEEPQMRITLIESTQKKAAFLNAARAAMAIDNVAVIPERIENTRLSAPDVITARALAPLPKLVGYAHDMAGENTVCLFQKGQDVEDELTEAAKYWHMNVTRRPSMTSLDSVILEVSRITRK